MNVTVIYDKLVDVKTNELNGIFKTTDDILPHFDDIFKSSLELIEEECDNPNHYGPELKKAALRIAKLHKFDPELSNFSSSQKKERKKIHELAKTSLATGITRAITQAKILEDTCVINSGTKKTVPQRTFSTVMTGFFRGPGDEKSIIEAINFINDENNKNSANEIKEKKEFVNNWFNGRIKDFTQKIKEFSYKKSDLELINFFKNNGPFVLGATEFQGDNVKQVAESLGINLDPKIYDDFKKVNHLLVDLGFEVSDRVGCMANPLYPEFTKDDIKKIDHIFEYGLDDLTKKESELKNKVDDTLTKNEFKSPYRQYFANPSLIISEFILDTKITSKKMLNEDLERIDGDKDLTNNQKEEKKREEVQKSDDVTKTLIESRFKTIINENAKPYYENIVKDRTNGEKLSFSLNGKRLSEFEGKCEALKGNRVQVFEDSVDELGKSNGKYLFTLQFSTEGIFVPINTGKSLEWTLDEAKEAANKSKQSAENKKQMFIHTVNGNIRENLDKLYDNLKSGSRFWISSKGEYGQLMNQIDECRKSDFENRKQLFEKIENIKKTASDYFMKRLDKTDRSDLAVQREEAVEKVLNTFGNEFTRVKEIEAEFDQKISKENTFVNKVKGNLKGLDQKELMDELDNTFSVGLDEFEKKQTSDIQNNFEKVVDENTYSKDI